MLVVLTETYCNKGSNEPLGSTNSRGYLDYLTTSFSRTPHHGVN